MAQKEKIREATVFAMRVKSMASSIKSEEMKKKSQSDIVLTRKKKNMFKLFLFWKKDYNKGLASVMGVFHKAISKAEELMARMEEEMDSNVEKINALQDRNAQIKKTHQETKNFASNLSKLLN